MQRTRWVGLLTASAMLGLCGSSAQASVVQSTIIGVFGGVITQGYLLHYPTLQSETYFDNGATADYSIVNGTNPATSGTPAIQATGSSLIFGDDYSGAGEPSILDFFGAVIPSDFSTPFRIGRLTYTNGRSNTTSQIFGATISFYDGIVSPSTFLGTDTIAINITADFQQSTSQDADYINICGNQSNICAHSIDAVETQEGGTGVTVDLYGTIVGDPQLFLDAVSVVPGQSPTTNGFVGSDRPLSIPIPEPSIGLLLLAGLIAPSVSLRRRADRPRSSPH